MFALLPFASGIDAKSRPFYQTMYRGLLRRDWCCSPLTVAFLIPRYRQDTKMNTDRQGPAPPRSVGAGSDQITALARSLPISSFVKPISASTSLVCSPNVGARRHGGGRRSA